MHWIRRISGFRGGGGIGCGISEEESVSMMLASCASSCGIRSRAGLSRSRSQEIDKISTPLEADLDQEDDEFREEGLRILRLCCWVAKEQSDPRRVMCIDY
ncbi:unnamed protein product [Rhizophagus irregularis]|nr:unnamed protein product [Rhizophagus irregularis]